MACRKILSSYLFRGYKTMFRNYPLCIDRKSTLQSFGMSTAIASSLVTKDSTIDSEVQTPTFSLIDHNHKRLLQMACSSSVNSTSELLTQILVAVIDSAAKYKNCLNELILFLERGEEFQPNSIMQEANDDEIIAARAQAKDYKDEFTELITMTENIEKLAVATAELSFLIGAETLAVLISERLYSVQQKIKTEMEEVRNVENDYLEVQQSLIQRSRNE